VKSTNILVLRGGRRPKLCGNRWGGGGITVKTQKCNENEY